MRPFETLPARVFAWLLLGILAAAGFSFALSRWDRDRLAGELHSAYTAEAVAQLVATLEQAASGEREAQLRSLRRFGIAGKLRREPVPDSEPWPALDEALAERLDAVHGARGFRAPAGACPPPRHGHSTGLPAPPCFEIRLALSDGTPLDLLLQVRRELPHRPLLLHGLLIYAALFVACIAALAYGVARTVTRPLRQLGAAARALGEDLERPPLPERGPREVREAAAAFNAMQARIRRHLGERTQMLAAITHDLQTPITRLRLRLEQVDAPELKDRLLADLSQVQALIKEGLELARSLESAETVQPLDLDALADSLAADAREQGREVAVHGRVGRPWPARPLALRRALSNLLDNALNYGEKVEITLENDEHEARIAVRDHGPGLDPAQFERVFEPFVRLEASRSRDSGGTGLGLTIARAIAERHGGSVTLSNHPEGGLVATLVLPQSATT